MPYYKNQQFVPYSVQQMFALVWDIEKYPIFLPWISKVHIEKHKEDQVIADLNIGYGKINKTYRSKVQGAVIGSNAEINAQADPGIFKYLTNKWQFIQQDKGSLIKFEVDFVLQSFLLQKALDPVFNKITKEIIARFAKQAKERFVSAA